MYQFVLELPLKLGLSFQLQRLVRMVLITPLCAHVYSVCTYKKCVRWKTSCLSVSYRSWVGSVGRSTNACVRIGCLPLLTWYAWFTRRPFLSIIFFHIWSKWRVNIVSQYWHVYPNKKLILKKKNYNLKSNDWSTKE